MMTMPQDIVHIILEYTYSPTHTYVKIGNPFQFTTSYFDWIRFLEYYFEEETKWWHICCNQDSPFYGCVLQWDHQNNFKIVRDIGELQKYIS